MPHRQADLRDAAALFFLLSSPTRLAIAIELRGSKTPIRLAEIKAEVGPEVSDSNFSATIRPLVSSCLVVRGRHGKEAYYELDAGARGRLEPLLELLTRREPRRGRRRDGGSP
jgi:DNA-binding transcriptional ArsR family regulator